MGPFPGYKNGATTRTAWARAAALFVATASLLAMVQATGDILTGAADPTLWIKLLAGYDIIFTTVSLLLFDVVLHAE